MLRASKPYLKIRHSTFPSEVMDLDTIDDTFL